MKWRILNVDGYEERLAAHRVNMYCEWMCKVFFLLNDSPRSKVQLTNVGISQE